MVNKLLFPLTLAALLGSGLIAGVFFAFSAFVMKGLAALSAEKGIAAMQSINVVVQNPLFFAVLFGTALLSILAIVFAAMRWKTLGAAFLLVGGILYLVGILVTAAANVPLNDALAAAQPTSAEGATLWAKYLTNWTAWNHVRTITSLAATAAFALALYRK